nr:hypothetical protein [Pseudomonas sp. GCEP-101]
MLAGRRPIGLRGVVFAATFASKPNPLLSLLRLLPVLPPSLLAQRNLIRQFCAGTDAPEALVALIADEIRRMPAALARARLTVLADLRNTNEPLPSPCLNLVPSNDRLVTSRARIMAADGCGTIKTKEIDGPHFLLQSRAQPCATAIMGFLNELS